MLSSWRPSPALILLSASCNGHGVMPACAAHVLPVAHLVQSHNATQRDKSLLAAPKDSCHPVCACRRLVDCYQVSIFLCIQSAVYFLTLEALCFFGIDAFARHWKQDIQWATAVAGGELWCTGPPCMCQAADRVPAVYSRLLTCSMAGQRLYCICYCCQQLCLCCCWLRAMW